MKIRIEYITELNVSSLKNVSVFCFNNILNIASNKISGDVLLKLYIWKKKTVQLKNKGKTILIHYTNL